MSLKSFAAICAAVVLLSLGCPPLQASEFSKTLRFAHGANTTTVHGAVLRGDRDVYVLKASAGQEMEVTVSAVEDNAAVVIQGPGRWPLPGAADGNDAKRWKGKLPLSGFYRMAIGPTRGNAQYSLTVSIR